MSDQEELIADSSALIYIAKAEAFSALAPASVAFVVVDGVWHETVIEGRRQGHADVTSVEDANATGALRRVRLDRVGLVQSAAIAATERLGKGESEVIAYAHAVGRRALIDDRRALRAARARGVVAFSTLALGVWARRAGRPLEESLDLLRALAIAAGARADVLAQYERRIREEHP